MQKVSLAASVFFVFLSLGQSEQASTQLLLSSPFAASHESLGALRTIAAVQPLAEVQRTRGLLEHFATFLLAYQGAAAFKPPCLRAGLSSGSPINSDLRPTVLNCQSRVGILLSQASVLEKEDKLAAAGGRKRAPKKKARVQLDKKPAAKDKQSGASKDATPAGGRPHTETSRMKISIANTGKIPWNVGKAHSSETRNKIREGMRRAAAKAAEEQRLERERLKREEPKAYAKLLQQEEAKKEAQRERNRERNRVLKEKRKAEKQQKIEEAKRKRELLKIEDPEAYAKLITQEKAKSVKRASVRRNYTVTPETKAKISASVKKTWKNETYRALHLNKTVSNETRAKLSAIIKAKWQNTTFRERCSPGAKHSAERRMKIAASIRAMWANNQEYRNKTVTGIRSVRNRSNYTRVIPFSVRRKISLVMRNKWMDRDFRFNRTVREYNDSSLESMKRRRSMFLRVKKRRKQLENPSRFSLRFEDGVARYVADPAFGGVADPMTAGMVRQHIELSRNRGDRWQNLPAVFESPPKK